MSEPVVDPSRDRLAWIAAAAGAGVYAWHGAPGPSWLDSGELIAAARELGGIHPPGHPAWLSLAALAEGVPLGPHGARIVWWSALCAGAALFLLVRIARRLLPDHSVVDPRHHAFVQGPGYAALALLASGSLWTVAVRAEVYTLALATNLWALDAALRAGDRARQGQSRLMLTALGELVVAMALGGLNHHYVALFAVPACVAAAWPALVGLVRNHRRWLVFFSGGGAWLLCGYFGVLLRAWADVELRWGDARSLPGLWDTVTARHFQRSVTEGHVGLGDNVLILFGMVADEMGWLLPVLGLAGLALLAVRNRRGGLALGLALLGGLGAKTLMHIDTRNPDDHGYVLLAAAALALGVGVVAHAVMGALVQRFGHPRGDRPAQLAVVAVAVALFSAAWLPMNWHAERPETNLRTLDAPAVVDSQVRRTLAPGALLLTNYYGLQFNEQAFRIGEGRRPDVMAAHLSFRTGDTDKGRAFQLWFARRYPTLKPVAAAARNLQRAPVGNLLPLAEFRPVYAEQDPDARLPAESYGFDGTVQRLLTYPERTIDRDVAAERERHERTWDALYDRLGAAAVRDHPTRAVLLWQHALQAAHALRRGWMTVADAELARARQLNPHDRLVGRLARRNAHLHAAWDRADTNAFLALWQRYGSMDFAALASDGP